MRVRTAISRLFWVAVVGFLIYAVVVAGASYFETVSYTHLTLPTILLV